MKKLIVPVFGLFLAACTYQFAPSTSEDPRRPESVDPAGSTATAGISLPSAPDPGTGFSPGVPGGGAGMGGPSGPDPDGDGSDGAMPDLPDMPGGG